MRKNTFPPRYAINFFRWFCHPKVQRSIEGDMIELYNERVKQKGKRSADMKFILDVLLLFRPGIIRPFEYQPTNHYSMYKSYLKIAIRNLMKYKGYSFINIAGLATGMAVAILIGLWIWDELSYNKYHEHYDRIAQVMQNQTYNQHVETQMANPYLTAEEIRNQYGSDFKYILQSSWTETHVLSYDDKNFKKSGHFFEPEVTDMLSLKMIRGKSDGLKETHSILLSASIAKTFFGEINPLDKVMKIDNDLEVKVTGVYEDLPYNSNFRDMTYILPWELFFVARPWIKKWTEPWGSNFTQTFALIADHTNMEDLSAKIKDVKLLKVSKEDRRFNPQYFLHPMRDWHLRSEFKEGVNTGGRIQFVWLFGIIGAFVLLLACINFMNLSTARSERRAKEVGIRKSIGSVRTQLIGQFFSESIVVALIAFLFSLVFVQLALPLFNEVADKKVTMLLGNPVFWLIGISFSLFTGIIAGSYPALYLSSFHPVKVLKGTFRVGRSASIPRKVLVVLQFSVSVTLIIGTVIVFQQIEFAKNRPVGYDREGLVNIYLSTPAIHDQFETVRNELISSGSIVEMAESFSPPTEVWNTNGGFSWPGIDPNQAVDFANEGVTMGYGKTVGWKFKEGRDFSIDHASDSNAFIVNETAARFIGIENLINKEIQWDDKSYTVIGIIEDMVTQSPYEPVKPSVFHLSKNNGGVLNIKINPAKNAREALAQIEDVFKKYDPATPFEYEFTDANYAKKFGDEERVGKLASVFAVLAIFISCLGIFGLASFVAEQRTKEIGVRKVLGASVFNLWKLLSRDFVILVLISLCISIPLAHYFMNGWLQRYDYRTDISWWIFAIAGLSALLITICTVSFQSIKAALANPVKSLRSE